MENFDQRVVSVFRDVFDNQKLDIFPEMQAKDVAGWDSLTHVSLMMAIEEEFGIKFSTKEVMRFRNVGEMLSCLKEKINSKQS